MRRFTVVTLLALGVFAQDELDPNSCFDNSDVINGKGNELPFITDISTFD